MPELSTPCDQCPWLSANQGKRHRFGFYRKTNLRRLWNGLRRGGAQSCHPTDNTCAEHAAPANAKARECPGSVIVITRELMRLQDIAGPGAVIEPAHTDAYLRQRPGGLTKSGLRYWLLRVSGLKGLQARLIGAGPPLPPVDHTDGRIALPQFLEPK